MLLSNKALLAALWHLYPDHPNLLPAYLNEPGPLKEWVAKPLHGREGDNIRIHAQGISMEQPGGYGREGWCYQQFHPLPDFDGNHPVLGLWVVDGESVGCGIRESDGPITDYFCRFVPNTIDAPAPLSAQAQSSASIKSSKAGIAL
jgi:glutathionylspermidine synthase